MPKQPVNHHAGNLLIESERTREVLTNQYDGTFPILLFRNRLNFIGGGKKPDDYSPEYTIRREINEEVSLSENEAPDSAVAQDAGVKTFETPIIARYASREHIDAFRESLLQTMVPYQDFLMDFSGYKNHEKGPKLFFPLSVFSVFHSRIPQELFEIARGNLNEGRSLVNDGFLRITSLDELVSGNPLCAWATGRVLDYHFKLEIPNPEGITATPIGMPRDCFKDYLVDFKYARF